MQETQETQNKSNPLFVLFKMSWKYSSSRKNVVLCWVMFFLAKMLNLVCIPLIIAHVINVLQMEGVTAENFWHILSYLALMPLVDLIFWAIHGPARLLEQNLAFKNRTNYRRRLISGVLGLPLSWHTEHHSGDTIDKINKGVDALYDFSEGSFQIIYLCVDLVVSICVLAYFCWYAGIVVCVTLVLTMWITVRFDRVLAPQYKELSTAENRIAECTFDAISNISTVVILRVERAVFGSIMHHVQKPYDLFRRSNRINEIKWWLTSMCCSLMGVLVIGLYLWQNRTASGGIIMGSFFLLVRYLDKITEVFFNFTDRYGSIVRKAARMHNAEMLTEDFRSEAMVNHVLPQNWQKVEVKNLTFSYSSVGGERVQLSDVSFALGRGKKIAFVGGSGGGKTTALKLIRGLYSPESLTLSVDGKEIPEGFEGVSQAISLVPQCPEIFANTIWQNITMGEEYTPEQIQWAVTMACFGDVLTLLPKGLESSTKEKGVNLSAGQNQRLALARGLLACRNKDIVLLDEPTSSLDPVTEKVVYQNIFGAFPEKTIVSSIHKLHLLSLFDLVYVFEEGKIVGEGTFDGLLAGCPAFQALWASYLEELSRTK